MSSTRSIECSGRIPHADEHAQAIAIESRDTGGTSWRGENRPIDVAMLVIGISAGLAIIAISLYAFYKSGSGDSISGRVNRWVNRRPLNAAILGAIVGFLAGLTAGVLVTHWAGWSSS